jgi:hypothetical protein
MVHWPSLVSLLLSQEREGLLAPERVVSSSNAGKWRLRRRKCRAKLAEQSGVTRRARPCRGRDDAPLDRPGRAARELSVRGALGARRRGEVRSGRGPWFSASSRRHAAPLGPLGSTQCLLGGAIGRGQAQERGGRVSTRLPLQRSAPRPGLGVHGSAGGSPWFGGRIVRRRWDGGHYF